MLNNRKIRVMTKLAIYETKDGKEDIKNSKYYKTDYVRYHVLNSIICSTLGYAAILLLLGLYKSEYLISKAVVLDYVTIGKYILGIYILVVALYVSLTMILYNYKYNTSKRKLDLYYKLLKRLTQIYEEENN